MPNHSNLYMELKHLEDLFIYLKVIQRRREKSQREREWNLAPAGSLPGWLQMPGLGRATARSQELGVLGSTRRRYLGGRDLPILLLSPAH